MKQWNLDHRPRGQEFCDFKKQLMQKLHGIQEPYTNDVLWRYFTILHLTGTSTRLVQEEHIANLNHIKEGRYYSKATVNTMETDYLTHIAELKTKLSAQFPDDTGFASAAQDVISRTYGRRQSSRSTRPGKINNHQRKNY